MRYNHNKNNAPSLDFVRTCDVQTKDDRLALRVSKHVKNALLEFCAQENISANSFINALIVRELKALAVDTRNPNREIMFVTDADLEL